MILVAGGDSFTYGTELKDQNNVPSMSTFPALLSSENSLEYNCVAYPGNSNHAILRMTMQACHQHLLQKNNFGVLVTWTFVNRYEFRFNYFTGQKLSPWYSLNSWLTLDDPNEIKKEFRSQDDSMFENQIMNLKRSKITGTAEFAKIWYKHVGDSEYFELYSTFKEILLFQFYLKANKIPYIFLTADNLYYKHPNYYRQKDQILETLYEQIDWKNWFFFDKGKNFNETKEPRGFYQWAAENKYPIGTTHPLEEAHLEAAKLIKEKFNELVTKPLEQATFRN
jgi:hypothetical protein